LPGSMKTSTQNDREDQKNQVPEVGPRWFVHTPYPICASHPIAR
jgi:hypothetical protein